MYKEEEVPYKVHTLIPVTFLVISISIVIMLTIYKPHYTVPGLLISLLGVPVYYLWKNKKIKN
jgi:APA family basic amino acid/polyamine antiporter